MRMQQFFWSEKSASGASSTVPLQTSAEFVHTFSAQKHSIVDAISATVVSAQAGLNWLRTKPPDVEEVRRVLDAIVNDSKRAAEIVVRLQCYEDGAHSG